MPIPKTYQTPHRTRIVKTRLSEEEYEEFRHRCDVYQVSQSEWLRQLIRTGRVHTIIRATLTSDELLEAIGKLTAQYGKIGSNLNQIARHFNSGGIHSQEMRKKIDQGISDIYEMKYEVLKMAGDFLSLSPGDTSVQKGDSYHGNPETYRQ